MGGGLAAALGRGGRPGLPDLGGGLGPGRAAAGALLARGGLGATVVCKERVGVGFLGHPMLVPVLTSLHDEVDVSLGAGLVEHEREAGQELERGDKGH